MRNNLKKTPDSLLLLIKAGGDYISMRYQVDGFKRYTKNEFEFKFYPFSYNCIIAKSKITIFLSILRLHISFGIGFNKKYESHFPNIKKGVLTPISYIQKNKFDDHTIRNINMKYAKDYLYQISPLL